MRGLVGVLGLWGTGSDRFNRFGRSQDFRDQFRDE